MTLCALRPSRHSPPCPASRPVLRQAFDGEQAITLCSQHHYDIIYMDIHMPNIGGLQATYHIRNSSNMNTYTPIIAFTSSGGCCGLDQRGGVVMGACAT